MTTPLVSILIPCYNAERWLVTTLKSALNQTWQNLEVIVVDDGSCDRSLEIVHSFVSTKVQVIQQANQGASSARNRALEIAQGEWIQYLDADDLLSPDKIEAQLQLLQQHPAKTVSLCSTVHFWDGEDPQQGKRETGGRFFADSKHPVEWLVQLLGGDGQGAMVHPAAWLIPRSVSEAVGFWDASLSLDDDGEYFARIVLNSTGLCYSPIGCTYYRKYRNAQSLSGSNSLTHQSSALRAIDLKACHLFQHTRSLQARRAIARCYMELAVQAYPTHLTIVEAALSHIKSLGVKPNLPAAGGWRAKLLRSLFGWKVAKRLSLAYHNRISSH
ncbi:MAG: glycosyltransferase family A protein [Oculatellaceae cyanobacterium bins.114]|nr:glycosyltransferase family A protein [Oculatellaceae cyanobacterium bins.114]